jgi:hypothetical protein
LHESSPGCPRKRPQSSSILTPALERQILTLLAEGHNSYSNIQTCLLRLTGQRVSIGSIGAVVQEAQQRALDWMASHAPATTRTLALNEIYANNRHGAYLNVVDTISWAVWAAEGPLAVDSESGTLLLWLAQERGLRWRASVSDGGAAIQAARTIVDPHGQHGLMFGTSSIPGARFSSAWSGAWSGCRRTPSVWNARRHVSPPA